MKYIISSIAISALYLFLSSPSFALTGREVLAKLNERLAAANTIKGSLTLTYQSGETYSGTFTYMRPGKISVKFSDPPGKLIITNGKKLWIYDAATDVCGVQELETEEEPGNSDDEKTRELKPRLGEGIRKFLRDYEARVILEASQYTIELSNDNKKYSEIKLILNQDFMLSSAVFKDKNGDGFVIKLSDVKTGEKITPGAFNFKAPDNAQVVKNPLNIR